MQRITMPRPVVRRTAGLVGVAAALAITGVLPAVAGAGLTASGPTTTAVVEGQTTRLEGMSVAGVPPRDVLAITVETSTGSVQVDTSTGITLAYGNAAAGRSVSFTGTPAQVNAALAATDLIAPDGSSGGSATVTLTAYPQETGIVYGPATGHFYEFVPGAVTWDDALVQAASRSFLDAPGYLVTITGDAENDIVTSRIPNAQSIWIGAHAVGTESYAREWGWAAGPEAGQVFDTCAGPIDACDFATRPGYSNWAEGEPNNWGGSNGVDGEWVAVTNWGSYDGLWNDLASTSSTSGYVVEYGDGTPFAGLVTRSATMAIHGLPGAPTGVSAAPGAEQATVSFTAPASDGGSAITSYTVTASPGGATATCAASPCVVTGLTAWTPYTFTVQATSVLGTGAASSPSAAVTPVPPPSAPGEPVGAIGTPVVGVPFEATMTSTGYPFPTFSVTGGALPTGLLLASDGTLSGTPTTHGPWSATITATNSEGSASVTQSGYVGLSPWAILGELPALEWGSPVLVQLSSVGYPTPTFAVTAGALPDGLTLTAAGRVSGTPTAVGPYAVTVAATNDHGTQTVSFSGSVDPVPPSAPAALVATAGDGRATLTFDAPDIEGGAPVTGYEVRVDSGLWQPLDTTADGSTVRGTVAGLANGVTVDLRVRAVNAAGPSPASGRATVTPVAPPPSPVAAPTAVAGTSSVTVSWTASTARDVTGYTVTASVGPATCHVDADTTSCVLGAVAGQAVTFRVVTHSRWGDSAPSAPSAPVVPRSPAVPPAPPASAPPSLTTTRGPLTTVTVGESITVIGRGFAPFSTATVVVYSEPRVLGTVVTDLTGTFSLTITVPTDLEPGAHTFAALGTDPAGETYALRLPVAVPAPAPDVAETGADVGSLSLAALTLVLCGAALHRLGSGRVRRSVA